MKILRRILGVLTVALAIGWAVPLPAQDKLSDLTASEQTDRSFLTGLIEGSLSGEGRELRLIGFEGALSSRATFKELSISDKDGVWLMIRNGAVQWDRGALLQRRVDIAELSAQEILLPRQPAPQEGANVPTAEAREFKLPELPVSLKIDKIAAERVVIGEPVFGAAAEVRLDGSVALEGGEGTARIEATRVDGHRGSLSLDAQYANETRHLTLELDLDEEADGIATNLIGLYDNPALRLKLAGDGPLDDFTTDVTLATEGQDRMTGRVLTRLAPDPREGKAKGRQFKADLSGDISPLLPPENRAFFGTNSQLKADAWRGEDGRVLVPELRIETGQAVLEGMADIAAGGAPETLRLSLNISPEAGMDERTLLPFSGLRVRSGELSLDYLREAGDGWRLDGRLQDVKGDALAMRTLRLLGEGTLTQSDGRPQGLDGVINFTAAGLDHSDAGVARALGEYLSGRTALSWRQGGALRLSKLRVNGAGYSAHGDLSVEDPSKGVALHADLTAAYDDIAQLSGLADRPLSGRADLAIEGAYTVLTGAFDARANITGTDITIGQTELDNLLRGRSEISLDAARGTDGITLRELRVDADQLQADAKGVIRSGASDVTAQLKLRDLQDINPGFGGTLDANARLTETTTGEGKSSEVMRKLTLTGQGQDLRLGQAQLDAALRGQTALRLEAREANRVVTIDQLTLNNPQLTAQAGGTLGEERSDASASFRMADLSVLGRGWGGAVDLTAKLVQDTGAARRFSVEGTGDNLALGQRNLDGALTGQTRLSVAGTEENGVITLDRAVLNNSQIDASASGVYGPELTDLKADLDARNLGAFGLGLRGALTASATMRGEGEKRQFSAQGQARNLAIGQAQADAVLAGTTRFSVTGRQDGSRVRIDNLDVSNPQITAKADGVVNGGARVINLDMRLADLGVIAPDFPGPATVAGQVSETASGYQLDLRATAPGATQATVTGPMSANFSRADLQIRGNTNAAIIAPFVGDRAIDGPINIDLRLNGRPGLEALSGRISGSNLRVSDPGLGISLPKLALSADLANGQVRLDGRAEVAAGGTVSVSGPIGLTGARQAGLVIDLNRVVLRDPDLYETKASGQIRLDGPLTGGARLTGAVTLIDTEIRVPSTGLGGSELLSGIRHEGDRPPVRATRRHAGLDRASGDEQAGPSSDAMPIALDLLISSENRLFVRGRGLDAELGGSLRLTGSTANIRPVGAFDLRRGRLEILTKRFVLDEGRLTMDGTLVPLLRFVASSQGADVTSFVTIEGPADNPRIVFSSTPELAEEEVIAQLLFDRSLDSLSAFQAAQLASAIATLAGKGGVGVVGRLRQAFGLDDLDVSSGADGETTVKAGKYLTDNLYTDVSVGSDGKTQIDLNLEITPNLKARGSAASDGESSIGLYYEKDY